MLQDGEVLRVGGAEPTLVDVRVVAATNRDLRAEITDRRFREDLFYRLNVIPVTLPPLRERRDDVLPLARHFLARAGRQGGRRLELGPEAGEVLLRHPWPGNVRELENAIERATILGRGDTIEPEDLLPEEAPAGNGAVLSEGTLQECLDACSAERIRSALAASGGRRAEGAVVAAGVVRYGLARVLEVPQRYAVCVGLG